MRLPLTAYRLPLTAYRLPLTALFCFSLTACQGLSDVANAGLGVLQTVNSTLSTITGVPTSTGSSSGSGSAIYIDQTAKSSTINAINSAKSRQDAAKMFKSASPQIEKLVNLIACNGYERTVALRDPEEVGTPYNPFWKMHHHRSGCLKVERIDNIQKKAANAFGFRVIYLSTQSEESAEGKYTAIQQPDGAWLFKWW